MRKPLLYPLLENELYWLCVLALFGVSLFVGIVVTNFFYRDASWSSIIMSDYRNWYGRPDTGLERYLLVVVVVSVIVLAVLNRCVIFVVQK